MSERLPENNELELSEEQQILLGSARELLSLPDTVVHRPFYDQRPTTRAEKMQFIARKLMRRESSERTGLLLPYWETDATKRTRSHHVVRSLTKEDYDDFSWTGGVYVEQMLTENLDTAEISERITAYAQAIVSREAATEMSSYISIRPWQIHLTNPIEDAETIGKLQADINEALAEYRS